MRIAPGEVIAIASARGPPWTSSPHQVKYAQLMARRSGVGTRRARQGADAILVTGCAPGNASPEDVLAAREGAGDCPALVGSGLAPGEARGLLEVADGAIGGTSLMGTAAWRSSRSRR